MLTWIEHLPFPCCPSRRWASHSPLVGEHWLLSMVLVSCVSTFTLLIPRGNNFGEVKSTLLASSVSYCYTPSVSTFALLRVQFPFPLCSLRGQPHASKAVLSYRRGLISFHGVCPGADTLYSPQGWPVSARWRALLLLRCSPWVRAIVAHPGQPLFLASTYLGGNFNVSSQCLSRGRASQSSYSVRLTQCSPNKNIVALVLVFASIVSICLPMFCYCFSSKFK